MTQERFLTDPYSSGCLVGTCLNLKWCGVWAELWDSVVSLAFSGALD